MKCSIAGKDLAPRLATGLLSFNITKRKNSMNAIPATPPANNT
jgi:hypothetical protein